LTEKQQRPRDFSEKRSRFSIAGALYVVLVLVIVIGTPFAIYWWNSTLVAGYDSDRVINVMGRYDTLDTAGRWLVQEGDGWNYGDAEAPSEIRVKQGEKVTLRVTSFDVIHGFGLEDYGIESTQIYPGTVTDITFVANEAGSFTFECTIECGEKHDDMVGELIVEPS
jgi:heme/copper-type cytochrome/quinol oxidase subunit 2